MRRGFVAKRLTVLARGIMTDTTAEERAAAAAMREGVTSSEGAASSDLFERISAVDIDEDARQKYVLIQVKKDGVTRYLVRGRRLAAYHKDAAQPTLDTLRNSEVPGMSFRVLGGGRILHSSENKKIEVFGFSYGFPWEGAYRHDLSAKELQAAYPDFVVETSDEGY